MENYWDKRYLQEGKIWGDEPSKTAEYAMELFKKYNVKKILIPGSGYGRNSKFFSSAGFDVTGVDISSIACEIAKEYDGKTKFHNASFLDISFGDELFDGFYCYNVLHFFRKNDRKLFIKKCFHTLKENGLIYFTVFSDKEKNFGKGQEVEENTFESKPGRPTHYFTEEDLPEHFRDFSIIETGLMEEEENHGEEGFHSHLIRYIAARNLIPFGRVVEG